MKIIDITEFYSERGGGIRSHLTSRGHFLCQREHEHVVLAPGPRDEDAAVCSGVAGGSSRLTRFKGPTLPYDRTYHMLARLDQVRECVRAARPDILEAHSPYLAAAAILACGREATRVRTLFWHSDHVGAYVEPALELLLGARAGRTAAAPIWRLGTAALSRFDTIFVAGRAQADRLRLAGVRRVVHAPFGVDTRVFRPGLRQSDWRRRWLEGASDEAPVIVGVGRFAVEKRWDVVLDAFARLRTRRDAVLVLFGDGPERDRLERAAPVGVRFAGFEPDRHRLAIALASADVLVHGGPYETFGLGIAEAVASGLPVVVPDAGGAAESMDRSCGEAYRSLDANACAAALERVLTRPPQELHSAAVAAALRVPTTEQHFAIVLNTYAELMGQHLARPRLRS